MKRLSGLFCAVATMVFLGGCSNPNNNQQGDETPVLCDEGVYVLCEGSFNAGNASLWFYDRDTKQVTADVFGVANDAKLGDVGQSLHLHDGTLFVVVNNSGVVYALDAATGAVTGIVENLLSPRYVAISNSGRKGYISQMYTNKLVVFDPATMAVTGEVVLDGVVDAEQMVIWHDKLFVAAWSGGNKVVVVDTATDTQIDSFEVGVQPYSMVIDKNNTIWVVCDGGNEWSPLPEGVTPEAPSLWKIDAESHAATKVYDFTPGGYFRSRLAIDASGSTLYFIYDAVWAIDVDAATFPAEPLIAIEGYGQYGLGVDPANGDLYIADAKDYMSNGAVLRYNALGEKIDEFEVGIIPSKFAFR